MSTGLAMNILSSNSVCDHKKKIQFHSVNSGESSKDGLKIYKSGD